LRGFDGEGAAGAAKQKGSGERDGKSLHDELQKIESNALGGCELRAVSGIADELMLSA
jgi:hypothetical protein